MPLCTVETNITCSESKGITPDGAELVSRNWAKGSVVELSAEDAASLLACGAVSGSVAAVPPASVSALAAEPEQPVESVKQASSLPPQQRNKK